MKLNIICLHGLPINRVSTFKLHGIESMNPTKYYGFSCHLY